MQIEKAVWLFCHTVQIIKILICREEVINKARFLRKIWIFRRNLLMFCFLFFFTLTISNRSNTDLYFRNSPAATQNNDLLLHLVLHWNSFHMILYKRVSCLLNSNGPCGARLKFCCVQLSGLQQVTKSRLQVKNARKKAVIHGPFPQDSASST